MEILKTVKTGPQDTIVILRLPDSYLDDLAAFLHSLRLKGDDEDSVFGTPVPATDDNFDQTVALIRSTSQLGEPMIPGKKRRVTEVLGQRRADGLFGPNYGAAAWDLFTPADPLKLVKRADGGWEQKANEKHNPALLVRLLREPGEAPDDLGPVARTPRVQEGLKPDADESPEDIWNRVIELSQTGKDMSGAQISMLNKVLGNSVYYMHPGNKNGGIDYFMSAFTKNRRVSRESKDYEPNPNFRPDALEYAKARIARGGQP